MEQWQLNQDEMNWLMQELNQDPGEELIIRTDLNNAMRIATDEEFGEESMLELENQILNNYEVHGHQQPFDMQGRIPSSGDENMDLRMLEERFND